VFDPSVATALALVESYGAVAVFVVFALEGALVGKVLPARTLFVASVVAVGVEAVAVLPVFAAAVIGATVGQSVVFVAVRRFDADPTSLAVVPVGKERLDGASRWFDRWGLPAVAASNAVPGTRGWLAVPTANASSVSAPRFAARVAGRIRRVRRRAAGGRYRGGPRVRGRSGCSAPSGLRRYSPESQRIVPCFLSGRSFSTSS